MSPTDPASEVPEARALAETTARTAGVRLVDLHDLGDLQAASRLFDTVWGRSAAAGPIMAPEALTALAHAGGQVTGAFRQGDLVGATAAFVGLSDQGRPHLHSHVTGVVPTATRSGIGLALKLHQRAWCLARGVDLVRWTFDPLVRRNAAFNLVTLGARAVAYRHDVYGPMDDERNAGLPTDRLVAEWDLLGPRVRAALTGRTAEPDVAAVRRAGAVAVLDVDGEGGPELSSSDAPRRLVRVPADIEHLRVEQPTTARHWAEAVRDQLGGALTAGMRITGFTRDGWYLLAEGGRVHELSERR